MLLHERIEAPFSASRIWLRMFVDVDQTVSAGVVAVVGACRIRPYGYAVVCVFHRVELPICFRPHTCNTAAPKRLSAQCASYATKRRNALNEGISSMSSVSPMKIELVLAAALTCDLASAKVFANDRISRSTNVVGLPA